MKSPEWPGIATAVWIILILMIAFDLSKWQTLAAALIAVIGGGLAYRGAVAKLEADEAERRREFLRRQLALYLKLELAMRRFFPQVQQVHGHILYGKGSKQGVLAQDLVLREPPEIEEAWQNLDVFPRELIRQIASIRECLRMIDDSLRYVPAGKSVPESSSLKGHVPVLDRTHESIKTIAAACLIISKRLKAEIEALAPDVPAQERDRVLLQVTGKGR